MMSSKTGKLRFKDDNGNDYPEWEIKKMGDIAKFYSGGTPLTTKRQYFGGKIPFIRSGEINSSTTEQFITEDGLKSSSAKMVEVGDILYALYGATSGEVGVSKINGAINQAVLCIKSDENHFYIYSFLKFQRENIIKTFLQGGQGNLSADIVKKIDIPIPVAEEQEKIANFLSSVDEKIEKLEEELEQLKLYKKGVMQQLFNPEGFNIDGGGVNSLIINELSDFIRFKDDNGNEFTKWKNVILKDVILKFIVPMRDKPKKLDGEIPWCRIEDFDGKYLTKSKSNQGVSRGTVNEMNLKIYPVNTLLVSCSANLGFCAIVKQELITNQTFIGLFPNDKKIDIEFLYYIMKLSAHRLNVLSSGTTISYLSREEFENFNIEIPCLEEQTKIANFLTAIDDKINQVLMQLDKTTIFKKGLLQQMFI